MKLESAHHAAQSSENMPAEVILADFDRLIRSFHKDAGLTQVQYEVDAQLQVS